MAYSFKSANDRIQQLNNYVSSFTNIHSDLMYNFYKEKVFNVNYNEIVGRLGQMFQVAPALFSQYEVNKLLGTILHKYKEYEKLYLKQRDLNATPTTPVTELESIPLTLERYTATLLCFLQDMRNGFNLFKVAMDRQQHFYKQQDAQIPDIDESQLVISNGPTDPNGNPIGSNDGFRLSQDEIMMHTNVIKGMIEHYIDNSIKKDFKYILELKLKFPH